MVLDIFCLVSGLKINMGKSVLLGINSNNDWLHNLANSIGCTVGNWPIKYLGLPLEAIH